MNHPAPLLDTASTTLSVSWLFGYLYLKKYVTVNICIGLLYIFLDIEHRIVSCTYIVFDLDIKIQEYRYKYTKYKVQSTNNHM